MAINSRKKGARGEKSAIKVLKHWTTKDFARVPSSGGLRWHNAMSTGDVICINEGHYFPFSIEVKFHEKIEFNHLLYIEKPEIKNFWGQCVRDAERVNKCPMLMMRYDRLPADLFFIAIPRKVYHKIIKPHLDKDDMVLVVPNYDIAIITSWGLVKTPYKQIREELLTYLNIDLQ